MKAVVARFRHTRVSWVVTHAFVVSLLAVGLTAFSRWNGGGGITEWYVPLRSLTAEEVAYLMNADEAWVIGIEDTSVRIATQSFVRYFSVTGEGAAFIRRDIAPATFSSFYSEYTVNREELERILERGLTAQNIQSEKIAGLRVSFRASDVPWYVFTETLVIAGALIFLVVAYQHLPSRLMLGYPLTIVCVSYLWFLFYYAPALVDADYFYQRVLLEQLFDIVVYIMIVSVASSLVLGSIQIYFVLRNFVRGFLSTASGHNH